MIIYSIIQKSQLEGAHRLDAEYYQPEYLKIIEKIRSYHHTERLADIATITTGPAYSSEEMEENFDIPLARIGDVTGKTDVENWLRLSQKEYAKFGSKRIKNMDVLMTMTGDPPDVGKCYLISVDGNETLAFNQRVAKLSAKNSPLYLFVYLNTNFGRLQAERNALGIRQRNLSIKDVRNTIVAMPSEDKQKQVTNLISDYLQRVTKSKSVYQEAENLLLEELGFKDFQIDDDVSFVVNLSDVQSANRIDAEYFQPKYERLLQQIRLKNSKKLGDLVTIKKGFEPGSEAYQEEGKIFIRVSSLSKNGIEDKDQKYLDDGLYQILKKQYEPDVGEILLTKDATPGVTYVLKEPIEGIISGGILRLKSKGDVDCEYLALCINSLVGQMQAQRDAGGSIIAHWKPEQVKKLLIPVLSKTVQQKIAGLVRQSHEARKKSKALLEEAKRKVEEMIEKNGKL